MNLKFEELRNGEHQPRFHGNGFIQLDLVDGSRLHVWDPKLDDLAQVIRTSIHDHRFSFISEVIYGVQLHQVFHPVPEIPGETFNFYHPVRSSGTEDTKLARSMGHPVSFAPDEPIEIPRGNSYEFRWGLFHDTVPTGLTATIMRKTKVEKLWIPRVAVPVGEEPDNNFDRELIDKDILWDSIRSVLELVDLEDKHERYIPQGEHA